MTPLCQLEWNDGILRSFGEGLPDLTWTRPANLAEARLGLIPPPAHLHLENGQDILTAAFRILPFSMGTVPEISFGASVTPAARDAFAILASVTDKTGVFRVIRGEPDDYIMFAHLAGDVWSVGALCVHSGSLTVRFEDLWLNTPSQNRAFKYSVDVSCDTPEYCSTLEDIAPDARIFLDIADNGGFLLKFTPAKDNPQ